MSSAQGPFTSPTTMRDPSTVPLQLLLVTADAGQDTAVGRATAQLVAELAERSVQVRVARDAEDAAVVVASEPSLACVVIDRGPAGTTGTPEADVVDVVRQRREAVPIFLMADRGSLQDVPLSVLPHLDGFVYLLDDSPDWIAGRLHDAARRYRQDLLPPMFAALVRFAETHEYSWHTPGHEGGAAFRKSPVGRAFWDFYGEQSFRSDLSVSVEALGSLLSHSGPIGEAEREAARIFGADFTFFVTNGTSTSNRVVHQAVVTAGDVVLLDRNAHKSIEQATTMTHAVPLYMRPTRNRYGIIGPVPPAEMTPAAVDRASARSPLTAGPVQPVLAMVTNSTYDGLTYHVPTVDSTLGSHVDRIHYDEAWYGYAAFNPLYHERHAMHVGQRPVDGPTTFATQSTHKLLAAFSQASYLHWRGGRRPIDQARMNEAFMMHASTSPQYSIIASNDVAAKMMEGRSGLVLTGEAITEAVAFRKTMARLDAAHTDDWFFSPWQPDQVNGVAFADVDDATLTTDPAAWTLGVGDAWHGFEDLPEGYAMLDPIKVTILTPGIAPDGSLQATGVPGAVVSAYLDQQASTVVEKTQDYSLLFLFSIGVTKGKWGSLVTALLECKRDVDANVPLERALPATYAAHPGRYAGMGLRDLAQQMHESVAANDQMHRLGLAFETLPDPAVRPSEAYAAVVRDQAEVLALDDMPGRTVAVGVVPYPPGIPLLMPGELAGAADGPHLSYLRALEDFDRRFPGFEHDIHGVDHVDGRYHVRCVR